MHTVTHPISQLNPTLSPLLKACVLSQIEQIDYWLRIDPLVEELNQALHLMAAVGDVQVLALILHSGADVNSLNEDGETALDLVWHADDCLPAFRLITSYGGLSSREVQLSESFDSVISA